MDNTNLVAMAENNNPDSINPNSIWNMTEFPSGKTNKLRFTPKQLKTAIIDYANTVTTMSDILKKYSIRRDTFYMIVRVYPEVREFYEYARGIKAHKYGETAAKIWENLPENPEFYVYDKEGNKSLSSAGAAYLRYKSEAMAKQAQIHETGSYVPASKQETLNRNLSIGVQINGKLPDDFDLNGASPDQLIDLLRGKGKS
jgi:hypothetical protein